MRPLFSDAPVMQAAPSIQTMPTGSQLAAALSQPPRMPNLPPASFGNIPLGSLMQQMQQGQGQGSNVTSSTPNLTWNPNNPVGTDTLGGNTANQGSWLGNAAAAYLPGYQGSAGTPAGAGAGAGGAYQPQPGDAALMQIMQQTGALAPQYQPPGAPSGLAPGMPAPGAPGTPSGQAPGMPGQNAPGMPTAGTPGAMGMIPAIYGNIYGGMAGGGG